MKHQTGIQWTHAPGYIGATWNPTTGCTRVSPGCDHCYAFTLHDQRYVVNRDSAREGGYQTPAEARAAHHPLPMAAQYDVPFSTVQVLGDERLTEPLRAKQPRAYFVDSMSDLFHEDVPDEVIDRVFAVMALSQYVGRCRSRECDHDSCDAAHLDAPVKHIFMILTKRPERMRAYMATPDRAGMVKAAQDVWFTSDHALGAMAWPLPNVWLGVTVEDQARADERIPLLLDTPAAVRFLSCEPLLEAVDLTRLTAPADGWADTYNALDGTWENVADKSEAWLRGVDWVIVGGESGKGARRFDLAWARSLRDQCADAGVAFFMKQLGSKPGIDGGHPRMNSGTDGRCEGSGLYGCTGFHSLRLRHPHGGNLEEWPEDLRVRQWPERVS